MRVFQMLFNPVQQCDLLPRPQSETRAVRVIPPTVYVHLGLYEYKRPAYKRIQASSTYYYYVSVAVHAVSGISHQAPAYDLANNRNNKI